MKIIVTGSAGFIGTHIAKHFSKKTKDLILVDKLNLFTITNYLKDLKSAQFIEAEPENLDSFFNQLDKFKSAELIIHMGAITNTAESDNTALLKWNVDYTKKIWKFCTENKIPLIYASSAATYGNGSEGFSDEHSKIKQLRPLNLYGQSKQTFDLWALEQKNTPPLWFGLKFFNVYGPYEGHKGRMGSAIIHGYKEITKSAQMTLFKSHNPDYKDGEQSRDFIFVEDILEIIDFLLSRKPTNGIYNCGTGRAQTFYELTHELFSALKMPEKVNWVDTPLEFRKAYQYKTEADMTKLYGAGFKKEFTTLKAGISNYLKYLQKS